MQDRREANRFLRNQQALVDRGMRRGQSAVGFIDPDGNLQLDGFNRPLPSGTFRWAAPWGPGDQVVVAFIGDTALITHNLSTGGPGDTGGAPPTVPPEEDPLKRDYGRTTVRDCGADPNAADLYQTKRDPGDLLRLVDPFSLSIQSYAPTDLETLDAAYAVGGQPNDLRAEARTWAEAMLGACAASTGVTVKNRSAYRSCATQIAVFDGYVSSVGLEEADRQSARPGHSEHQLGLTMDLVSPPYGELDQAFGSTPEGEWLRDHCHEYGFVLSYPSEAAAERTGYMWEPWHFRYVGKPSAAAFGAQQALYLNEYLRNIDAGAGGPGLVPATTGVGVQTRWTPIETLLAERGYVPGGGGGGGGGDHAQVHVLAGADHTGAISAAQHPSIGSGNLHPEYASDADLAAHALTSHGVTTHAGLAGVSADQHHAQAHVLSGADHTASGLTAGHVLRASAASAFGWAQLQHGDLGGVTAGQHHAQAHALSGADHTGTLAHSALSAIGANDHHAQAHVLTGADHTASGLTAGHVLTALTASTFGWQAPASGVTDHGLLSGLGDDDHPQYASDADLTAHAALPNVHHGQAHVLSGADHTGAISSAQHGTIASGNLHPEYVEIAGDTMTGSLSIQTAAPALTLWESDAAANNGRWDFLADAEFLYGRAVNDANSAAAVWLRVARTATNTDEILLQGDTLTLALGSGGMNVSGGAPTFFVAPVRLSVGTNGSISLSTPGAVPGVIFNADSATQQRADISRTTTELRLGASDANSSPGANLRIGNGVGAAVGTLGFYGVTPVARAAGPAAAPAGGVGTAAGGWSTAANRDAAIATINAMRTVLINLGLMS